VGPLNSVVSIGVASAIQRIPLVLPDSCPWTAASDAPRLRILSNGSGVGSGSITINGSTVNVTQSPCQDSFGGVLLDSRASVQPMIVNAESHSIPQKDA
jgi:hypothetical protein